MTTERDGLDALISKGFHDLDEMVREYPRLKAVEEAARDVLKWQSAFFEWTQNDSECFCSSELLCDFDNLRAALERK